MVSKFSPIAFSGREPSRIIFTGQWRKSAKLSPTVKPKLQWSYSYSTWAKYSHGHTQEILSTGNSLFSEMHILRSLSPAYHVFPPVHLFHVLFSAILWLHGDLLPINGTSFSLYISFLTYFLNHRII